VKFQINFRSNKIKHLSHHTQKNSSQEMKQFPVMIFVVLCVMVLSVMVRCAYPPHTHYCHYDWEISDFNTQQSTLSIYHITTITNHTVTVTQLQSHSHNHTVTQSIYLSITINLSIYHRAQSQSPSHNNRYKRNPNESSIFNLQSSIFNLQLVLSVLQCWRSSGTVLVLLRVAGKDSTLLSLAMTYMLLRIALLCCVVLCFALFCISCFVLLACNCFHKRFQNWIHWIWWIWSSLQGKSNSRKKCCPRNLLAWFH